MKITKKHLRRIIEQMALVPVEEIEIDEPAIIGDGGKASMARSQLFNLGRKAQSIHDKLSDEDQLPEWVQSKIAVMADNMDSVADYLGYQLHKEEMNEAYIPIELDIQVITDRDGITSIDPKSAEEILFKINDAFDIVSDLTVLLEASVPRSTRLDPRVQQLMDQLEDAEESIFGSQTAASHISDGTGS